MTCCFLEKLEGILNQKCFAALRLPLVLYRELTEGTNRKYRGGMRLAEDSAGINRTPSKEPLESFSLESFWKVSGELLELLQSI